MLYSSQQPHSPKTANNPDRPLSVDVEPQQPPPPSSTGMTSSYSATLPNIKKLGSGSSHPSVHQLPPFQSGNQQQMVPPMTQAATTPSSPPPQSPQPQTHGPSGLAGRHSKSLKSPHHLNGNSSLKFEFAHSVHASVHLEKSNYGYDYLKKKCGPWTCTEEIKSSNCSFIISIMVESVYY